MKTLGRKPSASRLARFQKSPYYKNGIFENIIPSPVMQNVSTAKVMYDFFNARNLTLPPKDIPSIQTDLKKLNDDKPTIVWFGHSSYLIKYKGFNVLVDPVFSGHASPVSFMIRSFQGANTYQASDMPEIDMLIITHDHYDHLDYKSILALKHKIKHIYTPLGVGDHLEHWGIPAEKITEFDWWQSKIVNDTVKLTATPSRHFSGRSIKRSETLWAAFVLELADKKIFIGGDSGYDETFKEIGKKFESFDLAILECGQYHVNWPNIHMFPEQTAQAAKDLNAKALLPVHWAKFALSLHAWNDPITRVLAAAKELNIPVTTPIIGEPIILPASLPNSPWWL
jgi:L-ascorbate metabolism protein UlaG (beta-lactamase superfamily)